MIFRGHATRILALSAALPACAAACAPAEPDEAARAVRDRIRSELPAAERWLVAPVGGIFPATEAGETGSLAEEGDLVLRSALLPRLAGSTRVPSWARPPRRGVVVRLPETSGTPVSIEVMPSTFPPITVRRVDLVKEDAPRAIVDGAAVYATSGSGADALWIERGPDIEELLLVKETGASVVYEMDLPPGLALAQPTKWLIEIREGRRSWLRMRFDRAFGPEGSTPRVVAAIEGENRVRVTVTSDAWPVLVDPTWQATSSMAQARADAIAVRLDSGEILVVGGDAYEGVGETEGQLDTAEIYDPVEGTFSTRAMTQPRHGHSVALLPNGKVLVAGGDKNTPGYFTTSELFDPDTTEFVPAASMGTERAFGQATPLKGGGTLITGEFSLSPAERYEAGLDKFVPVGTPIGAGRQHHTATVLLDGRVLLAGGKGPPDPANPNANAGKAVNTTELYDPDTGSFSAGPDLLVPRRNHRATLLPSGQVLITGGLPTDLGEPYASAEILDPDGVSRPVDSKMQIGRSFHVAELLPDGRVLLAGGSVVFPLVDLFDPVTEVFTPTAPTLVPHPHAASAPIGLGPVGVFGGGVTSVKIYDDVEIFIPGSLGEACGSADECESGFCRDGVCCESACSGTCRACSRAAKGKGEDGVCGPVRAGADPHLDCLVGKVDGSANCPNSGYCTDQGGCEFPCDEPGRACKLPDRCEAPACSSSVDCLSGYRCTATHACVLIEPDVLEAAVEASCTLGPGPGSGTGSSSRTLAWVLTAATLVARRRRGARSLSSHARGSIGGG